MKRLFFSFSVTGDDAARDFCRRLFARLVDHGIDVWIYESPGGRISSGESIAETCRAKIEECEMFVLLLNDSALRSDFVGMEVAHALWVRQQRELPVFPIIATDRARAGWPPQFRELLGFRGLDRLTSLNPVEDAVLDICARLGIDYFPSAHDARLPLARRLIEEIRLLRSATEYDVHDFRTLVNKSTLTWEAMEQEDYEQAREILTSIISDLRVLYKVPSAYYPRIALGSALLGLARTGAVGYDEVLTHFNTLIADAGDRVDASAHAGRANALMGLGRHLEAIAGYQRAEQALSIPDAVLYYNMARAQILAGLPIDVDDLDRRRTTIADGLLTSNPGDLSRIAAVLVLCHAHRGEIDAAQEIWRGLVCPQDVFVELIAEIADILLGKTRQSSFSALWFATELLDAIREHTDLTAYEQAQLAQLDARVAFAQGDVFAARAAAQELVHRYPSNPLYAVDAAMYAIGDDDTAAARAFCTAATALNDYQAAKPPLAVTEFEYLVGQAFWLLGDRGSARQSFRRSDHPEALWYRNRIPECFGAARKRLGVLSRWWRNFRIRRRSML